jgi:hypothetical protein
MGARPKDTTAIRRRLTGIVAARDRIRVRRPLSACLAGFLALAAASGCGSGLRLGASGYRLTSIETRATLAPTLAHGWFHAADENLADLYLTDLPPETLTSPEALAAATGNIVHLRMIVHPRAGRTPIEPTAISASVVHVVLSGGQIGVYEGGGFFQPSGDATERTFGGSIAGGSMHLGAATPGFVDRLGASQLSAGVRAERDAQRVADIRGALAWALSVTPRVARVEGIEPAPARAEDEAAESEADGG